MATIRITDRTVTITSKHTFEDFKEVALAAPRTLEIHDDEGNPIFGVFAVSKRESANVSPYGVGFYETTLDGKAKVSFDVEGQTANEVKDNAFAIAGDAFVHLQEVEAQIDAWKANRANARNAFIAALSAE